MLMAEIIKELVLLIERKLRNFAMLKLFIIANNQGLGNRFHSFTAKTHMDTFIIFFLSLCVLLS